MKQQAKTKCRQWFILVICLCVFLFTDTASVFAAQTRTYTNYLNDKTNGNLTTEFSGRVWADKTVTTADQTFSGDVGTITVQNDSDFLVTYSALATTQSITGEAQSPLDVVFVVDFSGSMISNGMDNGKSRLANTLDALNSSVKTLMEFNKYNRVAVVRYSGLPKATTTGRAVTASQVLIPLGHYDVKDTYFKCSNANAVASRGNVNVSWDVGSNSGSHTIYTEDATNTQMGLYTGMNLLTDCTTTETIDGTEVKRVPAVIHLSDGNPTVSSDSQTWWAPDNNSNNGNGVVRWPSAGNSMKALMTASYMKKEIDEHYGSQNDEDYRVKVYNIGMGLTEIYQEAFDSPGGFPAAAQASADITLNPGEVLGNGNYEYRNDEYSQDTGGTGYNAPSVYQYSIVGDIENAWNLYTNNQTLTMEILYSTSGTGNQWNPHGDFYENYTFEHPNNGEDINSLNYVDQYFAADNASAVTDVFEQIVSDITMSTPQVPTQIESGAAIDQSGYITYTDKIGDYMEVKDVKNLIFSGTNFTNPVKNSNSNDTVKTYTFSGQIDSPVYGQQNADDITITVTSNTDNTGKKTQTLTVKIPASAIPLRVNTVELDSSGNVKSHTTNNAYPVRLCYTVGVQEGVKNADGTVDLSKIDDAYKQANTGTDGLYFYSNKYTGDIKCEDQETAGNAYVEFTPAKNNPYFYVQKSIPLYTDKSCTNPVKEAPTPDDGKTYYYQVQYYSGKESVIETRSVTGIKGKTELINDQYCVKAGEMNAPRVDSKHAEKTTNRTATAELYYYAHMKDGNAQIHLGNNGRLAVKTASLAVEKDIKVPGGIDAGQFADQKFPFTVTLKDTDSKSVSGTFTTRHVVDDGNGSEKRI